MSRRVVRTVCRICAAGCGVLVTVDEPGPVAIKGDPDDPWSGGFTCAKGRAGLEFHRRPDRVDRPLMRTHGELVPVSWDDALDDVATRIQSLVDAHGPDAIAHYVGTGGPMDPAGYAVANGFFRSLGTTQSYSALSIDCSGKQLVPQLVSGVQLPFQPDLEHAALLIAFGVNTVVSHGHGIMLADPLVRLRALRARGGRLVVVDPRLTETARHADLHLAIRPTSDPALLAHLVRAVLADGSDGAYLTAVADEASIARLRAAVEPFDVDTTAATCDVPAEQLGAVVAMVRAAGRVAVETGTGTTMNTSANLTEWLVWALAAVTGSLDRRGGNTFNPGFVKPLETALPAGRGDLQPGPSSRPDLPRVVNGEMPCAGLADEIDAGHVRALIVRGGNPAAAFPDTERFRASAARLDLLVAIDARTNETTELATHVLPMADHFERGDLVTGYLQAQPFVRYAPAVVAPIGERRPQWWMFAELSRRLGLPLFGSARRDAALKERDLDDEAIAETLLERARHTFAEVRRAPYGILDDSLPPGWLIPGRLPHALDLAPAELVEDLAVYARNGAAHGTLVLVGRRIGGRYNSLCLHHSAETLLMNPADAERHGLSDGDTATVATDTGAIDAVVEVTAKIRAGVVSLPHGIGPMNVNRLTSGRVVDRRNGMPILSGFPVQVSARRALDGAGS